MLPLTLKVVNVPGVPNNAQQLINVRRLYYPCEMVKAMTQKLPYLQGLPPGRLVCSRYGGAKLSHTTLGNILEPDSHIVVTFDRRQPRGSPPGAQSADTLVNANATYSDKKVTQLHVNFYNGPIPIPERILIWLNEDDAVPDFSDATPAVGSPPGAAAAAAAGGNDDGDDDDDDEAPEDDQHVPTVVQQVIEQAQHMQDVITEWAAAAAAAAALGSPPGAVATVPPADDDDDDDDDDDVEL